MKKYIFLILLPVWIVLSCGEHKPLAGGSDIAIMTLVNDGLWEYIQEDLRSRVEYEIRTPQIEQLFYFSRFEPEDYRQHRNSKLVILIATLDGNDRVSKFIQASLSESLREQVASGERIFFYEYDKFARRQTYMLLLANNREALLEYIKEEGGRAFYQAVNRGFLNSQFEQLYHTAEEKELSDAIFDQFGFSFRFPVDYQLLEMDTARNILLFGRARPQRNILVYWYEGGFNRVIDQEWALRMKYWLMQNMMDRIYVERSYARYRTVEWGGVIVHNIRGLWGHPTKLLGGPFSMFYFYDGVTDRTYIIDCMLFAPGESKAVYLRQMEIIASTFYTAK
ncbi:MAG: DUF4837 family protein [FCB group bacterium]|nr:DUF4837 family protein [FCB group bacterium]